MGNGTDETAVLQRQRDQANQQELQASEIRYRRLFEMARDGILILDVVTRKITDVNPFMVELLGYTRDEFLGRELWEIGLLKDEQANIEAFRELQQNGYIRYEDLPLQARGGKRREVEFVSNVYAENGHQVIQCNIRDNTERKRAEESQQQQQAELRVLFDLMPAMIWFKDTENNILRVNKRVAEAAGKSVEEIEGRPIAEIYPQESAMYYADDLDVIRSGKPKLGIVETLRDREDKELWVQTDKVPFFDTDGKVTGIVVMAQDVTVRKQVENERDRFFTLSLDMLAIIGSDGYFKRINPAWEATLGFSNAEMMSVPFLEFVHPDDRAATMEQDAKLIRGGEVMRFENRYRCRDGSYKWMLWMCASYEDLIYCVTHDVTEAKQAERTIRESEEYFRFLNDLGEATRHLVDADQVMAVTARMLGEHLGASRCAYADVESDGEKFTILHDYADGCASTVGKYQLSLFGPRAVATLNSGETLIIRNVEEELLPDEGAAMFNAIGIQAIITCPLVKDGVLRAMMAVHQTTPRDWQPREITLVQDVVERCWATIERRRAEDRILQLNTELEQRVMERTADLARTNAQLELENIDRQMALGALREVTVVLEQAKREAEAARENAEVANHAKSEFLSRMSHELRTPMNAILGFGQILEMRGLGPSESENVDQILKAGRHLLQLINEVLDISRIEAGHMPISSEPVCVADTLNEALELVRPLADHRHIHIVNEMAQQVEWHVVADRQRLKQVMLNILANAVKYNRDAGEVTISGEIRPAAVSLPTEPVATDETIATGETSMTQKTGEILRLSISDTGAGLSEAQVARLFIPFERLGAEQKGVEGTGIGLALSKQLVEIMGGTIGVESTVGVGSVFWFELPLTPSPIEQVENLETPLPVPALAVPQSTLLYIEDNLSNLALIEHVLAHDSTVLLLSAMQGSVGLDLARLHHPDLILLDLHLPDMTGDEVLRRLQAELETRDIPVIIVSADATSRQIERLLAAGARDYLTKPLDLKQFLQVVTKTLNERNG